MSYFTSRDVAAIAMCAALWGVLNGVFSPLVFRALGLPFLCDLIGFTVLAVAVWWIRKFGAATAIGLVATPITLSLNPGQFVFLGFTAASFVFDLFLKAVGYEWSFRRLFNSTVAIIPISIVSAAIAGYIIGSFFVTGSALARWGGVGTWVGLHAMGGTLGGLIGLILIAAFSSRKIGSTLHPSQSFEASIPARLSVQREISESLG